MYWNNNTNEIVLQIEQTTQSHLDYSGREFEEGLVISSGLKLFGSGAASGSLCLFEQIERNTPKDRQRSYCQQHKNRLKSLLLIKATGDGPKQDAQAAEIDLVVAKLPEVKKAFVLLPRRLFWQMQFWMDISFSLVGS